MCTPSLLTTIGGNSLNHARLQKLVSNFLVSSCLTQLFSSSSRTVSRRTTYVIICQNIIARRARSEKDARYGAEYCGGNIPVGPGRHCAYSCTLVVYPKTLVVVAKGGN